MLFPVRLLGVFLLSASLAVATPPDSNPDGPITVVYTYPNREAFDRELRQKRNRGCAAVALAAVSLLGTISLTFKLGFDHGVAQTIRAVNEAPKGQLAKARQTYLQRHADAAKRAQKAVQSGASQEEQVSARVVFLTEQVQYLALIAKLVRDESGIAADALSLDELFLKAELTAEHVTELKTRGVFDGVEYWPLVSLEHTPEENGFKLELDTPPGAREYLRKQEQQERERESTLDPFRT